MNSCKTLEPGGWLQ